MAVVGAGEFGRNHARVYRELPNTELVGVYDRRRGKSARGGRRNFTRARLHDLNELRGSVKAASVAVPTEAHSEVGCRVAGDGHRCAGGKADGQRICRRRTR